MRKLTVIEDDTERPVIKEVFKWEVPKDKTVQQSLNKYRIRENNNQRVVTSALYFFKFPMTKFYKYAKIRRVGVALPFTVFQLFFALIKFSPNPPGKYLSLVSWNDSFIKGIL